MSLQGQGKIVLKLQLVELDLFSSGQPHLFGIYKLVNGACLCVDAQSPCLFFTG